MQVETQTTPTTQNQASKRLPAILVETTGIPTGPPKKNGITAAYRLISTLRLNPPTARRRLAVRASSLLKGRVIVLPVKNTGKLRASSHRR